jgi:hypothetical protein
MVSCCAAAVCSVKPAFNGTLLHACAVYACLQALDERDKLHAQLQQVGSLQQQLAAASVAAATATSVASGWEEKFMRERAVRRKLHEQLQVRSKQQQQC